MRNDYELLNWTEWYIAGYFRKNPTNVTCREGEVVHITCETIESCISAQWCKDGMDIDCNYDKFSIKQNRTKYQLTIRSASKKDNGCYSVNVNGRIRMADVSVRGKYLYQGIYRGNNRNVPS